MMSKEVRIAFQQQVLLVALNDILGLTRFGGQP